MRTRRNFSADFKRAAVLALLARPVAEVARDCDVSISVLHRWRRQFSERVVDGGVDQASARRRFSKEVKASAVDRLERGASIAEVAASLSIRANTVHRWRKEARDFGAQAFSGYGRSRSLQQPGRAIKITLEAAEYQRILAAFESSSARSLPDFARATLLEDEDDAANSEAIRQIDEALDRLAGILKRILWIAGAAPRSQRAAASHS